MASSPKLAEAERIAAGWSDFELYMMAQPTRGPDRYRELTRAELIAAFARSHTLRELRNWR